MQNQHLVSARNIYGSVRKNNNLKQKSNPNNEKDFSSRVLPSMYFKIQEIDGPKLLGINNKRKYNKSRGYKKLVAPQNSSHKSTLLQDGSEETEPAERNLISEKTPLQQTELPQQASIIDTFNLTGGKIRIPKKVKLPAISNLQKKNWLGSKKEKDDNIKYDKNIGIDNNKSKSFFSKVAKFFGIRNKGIVNEEKGKITQNKNSMKSEVAGKIYSSLNGASEIPQISEPERVSRAQSATSNIDYGLDHAITRKVSRSITPRAELGLETALNFDVSAPVEYFNNQASRVEGGIGSNNYVKDLSFSNEFSNIFGAKSSTTEVFKASERSSGIQSIRRAKIKYIENLPKFKHGATLERAKVPRKVNAVLKNFEIKNMTRFIRNSPAIADIMDRQAGQFPILEDALFSLKRETPQVVEQLVGQNEKNFVASTIKKNQLKNYDLSTPLKGRSNVGQAPTSQSAQNVKIVKLMDSTDLSGPLIQTPAPDVKHFESRQLKAGELALGMGFKLGKKMPIDKNNLNGCVDKNRQRKLFCIETLEWTQDISDAFGPSNFFSGGGRAIVRYDLGRASQYHVLFPTGSFLRISKYLLKRYGGPSELPQVWTPILGGPSRLNRTLLWRAPAIDEAAQTILEIRQIDDLRWSGLPQTEFGVIRLYREGAKPIFETLTTSDLMMMQIRNNSDQVKFN